MGGQDDEFSRIARELLEFVNGRPFDLAFAEYEIYDYGARIRSGIENSGTIDESGPETSSETYKPARNAARALVESMSEKSGERAWGLTFRLWPDGKFKVEYSYEKPAWLQKAEDEDRVSLGAGSPQVGPKLEEERSAFKWLQDITAKQTENWGLGRESRWNIDVPKGRISWYFSDGTSKSASIQFLGTLAKADGQFRWAWENPSIPEQFQKTAWLLRNWGIDRKIPEFIEAIVKVDELRVWSWAAMGAQMTGAQGAYRVDADGVWLYVVFDDLS